jgi:hypothetical protein
MSKNMSRNIIYFRQMATAIPVFVDHCKNVEIYKRCKAMRRLGLDVVVDHIVPLNHPYVCGLHWDGNLQIIPHHVNRAKSNKYWPDQWEEQLTFNF